MGTKRVRFRVDKIAAPKFKQNLAGLADRFESALLAAANAAASLIRSQGQEDISNAGNFAGSTFASGFHVDVEGARNNITISMYHDDARASIFQNGGVIEGNPFLWIPLSGTDAKGIAPKNYPGGLFSVNRKSGGAPLLFSKASHKPKYFGISQVTIPKKFHLTEIQASVMANFRQFFDDAFRKPV